MKADVVPHIFSQPSLHACAKINTSKYLPGCEGSDEAVDDSQEVAVKGETGTDKSKFTKKKLKFERQLVNFWSKDFQIQVEDNKEDLTNFKIKLNVVSQLSEEPPRKCLKLNI